MEPFALTLPIETERLRLRAFTAEDAQAVHAYQSLPEVARYQLYEPRTLADVRERVARDAAARTLAAEGDAIQFAVERRVDAALIGDLYFGLLSTTNATGAIGWTLAPAAQGLGYATEGARALLRLAFETIGLHRLRAEIDPRNVASARLCLRLGMRHEGHFVQDLWFKGAWADSAVYALLAEEWPAAT